MRNLKRALSLTLASVMLLGMMVVGSSAAAGYSDVDDNDNVEAIEVLQAVEVMVGDDRGFGPDRPVTRNEMAVVMGKLLNLNYSYYVSTCPFTDVADWAKGWVGACYANGIVSGRGQGIYDGEATVTAVEAASMMMRALGYFKNTEDYADGFNVVTVRQGSEIGIFNNVGTDAATPMTRNQVAQMALNALQANMVTFTGTPGIEVNGVKVGYKAEYTFRSGTDGKYSAISDQGNTTDGTTNQSYIQLGEELYDGDLRLNAGTTDSFGRPARYWEYDGKAIGTYAKKELLRKAYTEKVTGKDLYDLLGKDIVNLINGGDYRTSYTLDVTIDGNVNNDPKTFGKSALTRTNTDGVGGTGNGVLTEVYVDNTARTVDIAIINTYLAIAENDYNEKKDEVSLKVYNLDKSGSPAKYFKDTDGTKNAETTLKTNAEDLDVAGVKKDDKFLVTVANGELKSAVAPEILTEQTISSHKVDKYVVSDKQYDYATTAQYDVDVMENFGSVDMKEVTYNIVLDKYGYLIGVEQNEEIDQYVFLTGIDDAYSHLSQKNVPVNIIHLDGTMETVTMNTKKSTKFTFSPIDKAAQANTWCTYSVDNDGIYTLTQVASVTNKANKVKVAQSAQDAAGGDIKINSKNISLNGDGTVIGKVHGNDSTVYINVDMINVDVSASAHRRIVDDVDSVVTGVTNVDLTVKNRTKAVEGKNSSGTPTFDVADNEVYTLYKDNGTIIAVVTLEALDNATTKHYAYISSSNIDHRDYDATAKEYSWYREAIVDGEFVMLKEVDDSSSSTYVHNGTGGLKRGQWYEIKYNADGEVRGTEAVTYPNPATAGTSPSGHTAPSGNMPQVGTSWMEDSNFVANAIDKTFILQADYNTGSDHPELKYVGGTLYTGNDTTKGVYVAPTAKVVVFTKNYDKHEEFTGAEMEKALAALNDKEHFNGYVNAVIGSNGVATVVIIDEKTLSSSGNAYTVSVTGDTSNMGYTITDGTTTVSNTSLTVTKGANVTVTFTANEGYVFTVNNHATYTASLNNVTSSRTVTAPVAKVGTEKVTLDVQLGRGVGFISVSTDGGTTYGSTYGNGRTITGDMGQVLMVKVHGTGGTQLTTNPAPTLVFHSNEDPDNLEVLAMDASSHTYVVALKENGALVAGTDGLSAGAIEIANKIENRVMDVFAWFGDVGNGNYQIRYYIGDNFGDPANMFGDRVGVGRWTGIRLDTNTEIANRGNDQQEIKLLLKMVDDVIKGDNATDVMTTSITGDNGTAQLIITEASFGAVSIKTGKANDSAGRQVNVLQRTVTPFVLTSDGKIGDAAGMSFTITYDMHVGYLTDADKLQQF